MSTLKVADTRVQVETATGVWTTIRGIRSLDFPPITAEMGDTSGFENDGYASAEPVAASWSATVGIWRKAEDIGGALFSEHEFIRLGANTVFNGASRMHFRFFDKNARTEAYDGYGYVTWKAGSGDWKSFKPIDIAIAGDGALTTITNPLIASQVPDALTANVLPTAQTAGNLVVIKGNNMIGTTGLTVNAVAVGAGKFTVLNANTLAFIMPAGSAGAGNIVITNAAGPSATITYTRGA